MSPGHRAYAIVLGTVAAMAPLGMDMYLPAVPDIARDLGTDEGVVQLSLVSFFLGLSSGQLFYGPVSDRFGRKPPLFAGLGLFLGASLGCILVHEVNALILLRFVQGIGGCAGMVVGRAIVRDLSSGVEAVRLYALVLLVIGITPIIAPFLGSGVLVLFDWPAIFWFYVAFAAVVAVLVATLLPETHPPGTARAGGLLDAFTRYGGLLRDRRFVGMVLLLATSKSGFYVYLAAAPFLYISLYGVVPWVYSGLFAVNAIALLVGQQAAARYVDRIGATRLVTGAIAAVTAIAIALLVVVLIGEDSLAVVAVALFACIGCLGLIFPPATMMAMEPFQRESGAASALIGTIQFAVGSLASACLSLFFDGTAAPFAAVLSGCAVLALITNRVLLGRSGGN